MGEKNCHEDTKAQRGTKNTEEMEGDHENLLAAELFTQTLRLCALVAKRQISERKEITSVREETLREIEFELCGK